MVQLRFTGYSLFAIQLLSLLASTEASGSYLDVNGVLSDGEQIDYIVNGNVFMKYRITMQNDCNFVFYGIANEVYWASDTVGQGTAGSCYVIMQEDCNLVIYPDANSGPNGGHLALWSTETYGMGSNCFFQIGYFDGIMMGALLDGETGKMLFSTNAQ